MSWIFLVAVLTVIAGTDGLSKRSFMPGGAKILTEEEIKNDKILQSENIFMQIADTYNKMSNSLFASRIADTVEVKKRIVAGVEYEITIQFTPTECKKNADKYTKDDLQKCQFSADNGRPQTCTFTAWFRPWLILGVPQPVKIEMKSCRQ
ncbi:cystatin-1-like [Rhopilema esculentum]|uniref:cystatin-1-like n=1 Tax=Rhopilema esculentum TaxID=499914 RepID=UPI0031E401FA|eukprot:gene448-10120_t